VHKRSSASHVYSHCLVIHFAAHPPSNLWPKGIAACSHAEWVGSCALAERKASRWRKEPCVEAIEILEATLRANDGETSESLKFSLEGVGQPSHGHAKQRIENEWSRWS
jgi:hypothetical protein